ncbi:MAG: Aerobic carbon monoxide dehydrogenase (quinone), large chain [uncultured Nocardioidaceae bacterium]|uniref:Aerobic carbon monoxide dehydrogenase (Quinone), large chain n=1 Tax=uncultured Nocardioidaceae bacterium TaxID=253824 RepID=A0A6J4N2A9_9ACTN|nr:MAG: Aerobic carbon monoxide dehydrogenase (quinone), large chain [uncultured Nocardioidaceae bacterium]
MEVDTETGATTMRKYVAVDDIGNIINPLIVSGQVHGGLVQGIAQALWEEAVYDESGTMVTASFVDYTLPTAADTISFEIDHTTSPASYTSLGTKGVGEAGTIASTPAVVNAIVDALRPLGVDDVQMPCTPERVYKAIRAAVGVGDSTAHDVSALGGDAPRDASGQAHFSPGAEENADPGATGGADAGGAQ